MIFPPLIGPRPVLGVWELGVWLGALALTAFLVFRALGRAPLVPVGDPYLAESLR